MKKIVLTGGGTAGHIYPALALVPYLNDYEIHYIGSNNMEKEILKNYKSIIYHEIPSVKLIRKFTLKNFLIPFKLYNSISKSKKILREINPNIIFSKGGFVSVPVVFAGKSLKIPIVSHESDLSMGLANKLILKKCDVMCTTFIKTTNISKKCIFTGQPIRQEILNSNSQIYRKNFFSNKPILLVIGGSQGAKFLNEIVRKNLKEILKRFNVIHLTGKNNLSKVKDESLIELEYSNNISELYSSCDFALSRAGSGVINELLALKKPMLLIPLSKKCSRGDQIENAKYFKDLGYADLLLEDEYTDKKLVENLDNLIKNRAYYVNNMRNSQANKANEKIIEIIKNTELK